MNFLKRHKWKITGIAVALLILVIAFIASGKITPVPEQETAPTPCVTAVATKEHNVLPSPTAGREKATSKQTEEATLKPQIKGQEQVSILPTSKPQTEKQEETDSRLTCTLSINCHTILSNMAKLKPEKTGLIPSNGVIFPETEVEFYKGESVVNVLTREMKKNKIHLEFVNVPLYNSAYIEGIANIYEHDCGELSGWMYRVNGTFPNHGASQYKLKKGDRIEWLYTCDMGTDIGGGYSPRNGRKDDN